MSAGFAQAQWNPSQLQRNQSPAHRNPNQTHPNPNQPQRNPNAFSFRESKLLNGLSSNSASAAPREPFRLPASSQAWDSIWRTE